MQKSAPAKKTPPTHVSATFHEPEQAYERSELSSIVVITPETENSKRKGSGSTPYAPPREEHSDKLDRAKKVLLEYAAQKFRSQKHILFKTLALLLLCLSVTMILSDKMRKLSQADRAIVGGAAVASLRNESSEKSLDSLAAYESALSSSPDDVNLRLRYAQLLLRADNVDQTLLETSRILQTEPNNREAQKLQGICNKKLGQYREAIASFKSVLEEGTADSAEVRYHLYDSYLKLGNKLAAYKYIDQAAEEDPSNVRYKLDRAALSIELFKFDAAKTDLDQAIEQAPYNSESRYLLGLCAYRQQNLRKAVGYFSQAEELGFKDPSLYLQRSKAFARLERYHDSLSDANRYLALMPDDPQALRRKTELEAIIQGRMLHATSALSVPEPLFASKEDALNAGYEAMNHRNYAKAISILSSVARSNPNEPRAHRYLAHALFRSEKFEEAVAELHNLNRLEGVSAPDALSFAEALSSRKHHTLAADVLYMAIKSDPNNHEIRMQLAAALSSAKQTEQAKAIATDGLARTRDQREIAFYNSILTKSDDSEPGAAANR